METITKLFVYGSLRKGFRHPAYNYISRHFNFLSEAKVQGLLYDMGQYPAALPTVEDLFIVGELYELKEAGEFEWAMGQLDDYEGLNPEVGEAPLYRREIVPVFYDATSVQAWMYWFNESVAGQPLIPGGDFLAYMTQKSQQ